MNIKVFTLGAQTPSPIILSVACDHLGWLTLGLFVFFYATLHLLTYVGLDYRFDWQPILDDVVKKKYIFIGFAAWLLLIPLAITSSKKMVKLLKNNWKKLHRLIYVIAIFGSLHYIWLSKTIFFKPLIYFIIIILLLAFRIKIKNRNVNYGWEIQKRYSISYSWKTS